MSAPSLLIRALLPSLLAAGCATAGPGKEFLDAPVRGTVLEGGPFADPIGFVASARSGRIAPLDLKRGTYLSDSLASPFLPPRGIATGDQRQLGDVAAFSPSGTDVVVYAADLYHKVLIEAPYILDVGDDITIAEVTASEPIFNDADASGDDARFSELSVYTGTTPTEDWSVSYDGEKWWVTGSRSGPQGKPAYNDIRYISDNHELEFVITGSATLGDALTFSTDGGLLEHDLGGSVLDLLHLPGLPYLACAVWDGDADQGWVTLFDMASGAEHGRIDLPAGAQAWRLDLSADGSTLYVADAHLSAAYAVTLNLGTPALSPVVTIPTDGPLTDLAWVGTDTYSHLFVAVAGQNRVDVYDLDSDTWLDVNPYDGRTGGVDLRSPVIGMDAAPGELGLQEFVDWSDTSEDLVRREDHIVALTTLDGALVMLEGATGCLARTSSGSSATSTESASSEYDYSGVGSTTFYISPATNAAIQTPRCGGMVFDEKWTVTYDGVDGTWIVEGARSGEQAGRALLDQRYLSDDGAISFTLLSGSVPPADGDVFSFDTRDGVLRLLSYPWRSPASPSCLSTARASRAAAGMS